ncbi:MAG TPA: 3-phosphoshikimate 1-carboxyvinyltransferase [Thermoanaerobaculia bacterium]|nr:3-phosphoshikimate 1-carboxyvinyltransferase [Thermoanaerobaculia bacterium]
MRKISKSGPVNATLAAPPSKSLSVRALLLAAMTDGETTVEAPLDADDTRYLLDALRKIGFEIRGSLRDSVTIGDRVSMTAGEVELFVGNAGTAMRFLTGWLAFTPGRFILRGETRMHQRPIHDLVEALRMLGTEAEYVEREGFPPLRIRGRRMRGGFEAEVEGERSSQFVSAMMMAGATLPDGLAIRVASLSSHPYVDLTAGILRDFSARVEETAGGRFTIRGPLKRSEPYRVEGDWSSASYWLAAAAATRGRVTVTNLRPESAQGDRAILSILARMGAQVETAGDSATVEVKTALAGGSFDCNATPDLVPTLAALAPLASSPVEITNIATLRLKESDRIAALAQELRKLGATVDEREDAIRVENGWGHEQEVILDSHDDHRIAMAFAITGLARGGVTIDQPQVVGKSYPGFWKALGEITGA